MNNILPLPINEKRIAKTIILTLLLSCLLPIILNMICITPIFSYFDTNIIFSDGPIPLTLEYILDLLDIIAFGSVYAIIIFSLVLLKNKVTIAVAVSYISLLILKIPAKLLLELFVYKSITTAKEIDALLFLYMGAFILEILQFAIVYVFSLITSKSYLRSISFLSTAKRGKNATKIEHILPIKKFINWYNPLLRAAIYSSVTVILFRFFSRLIFVIEEAPPVTYIIIGYITDAIYGIVAYLIAIFIFNLLFEKLTKGSKNGDNTVADNEQKNKTDENNSSALFED